MTEVSESAALKGVQKLQRAIIDGLEDVKAQDIVVFNTAHLTSLFERVIVASGTSNRQTKALAASVRDAVKDAGFPKPRIEGEDNGEWIVVDCGAAVAHIMQPTIRAYYHLEEIWGGTPVRVKFGATKPAAPAEAVKGKTQSDASRAKGDSNYAGRAPGAAKTAQRAAEQLAKAQSLAAKAPRKRSTAGSVKAAAGKTAAVKKPASSKSMPVKTSAKTAPAAAKKVAAKTVPVKAPGKTPAKKPSKAA